MGFDLQLLQIMYCKALWNKSPNCLCGDLSPYIVTEQQLALQGCAHLW